LRKVFWTASDGDGFVAAGDDESVAGEAVVVECVEGSDGGFVAAADG
jgi:hypothetical protein